MVQSLSAGLGAVGAVFVAFGLILGPMPASAVMEAESQAPDLVGAAPAAFIDVPYSFQFELVGGAHTVIAEGLPSGLSIDAASAVMSGIPDWTNAPGEIPVTFTVSGGDHLNPTQNTRTLTLSLRERPAELTPGVENPPLSVQAGGWLSHQFTLTGPGTFLKLSGLPEWLNYDWTSQRISGAAPKYPGTYQFDVIARNAYDAVRKTFSITVTHPSKHHILTAHLTPLQTIQIPAFTCPADAPYLRNKEYNATAGRGIEVVEPGGIAVIANKLRYDDSNEEYATGILSGLVTNWAATNTVSIYADCTNDKTQSYTRY